MEALVAVGLATNIITFVDFAATLVKGAKEISSSGSLSDLDQIQSRTTHLQRLVEPLQVHPGLSVSSGGRELDDLARNCVGLAAETTTVLDKIYGHVQGPLFLRNARVAFRALRNKEQLESLQKRLDSYQSLILTQVALLIHEDQMAIFTLATDISKRNDESATRVRGQLDSLRGYLISAVNRGRTDTAIGQANISCLLEDLKSKLEHLIQIHKDDPLVKTILDKLWFDGMLDRESAVHDPVSNSYGWLLDPQPDHESERPFWDVRYLDYSGLKWQRGHEETRTRFNHWLTAEAGLFYISGKPGSGKSTLMKFLVQKTRSRLEVWAAAHSRKLLVVSFFFWISGTSIQRSVEGLYRAVLWEILKASPQLIPEVFPSRWKDPNNKDARIHHLPLSYSEIRQALERLKKALNTSHALCLFIDGLDEYDGDHWILGEELVSWKSDHVKICVSARPYNAFDQKLPRDSARHFRLQDLNARDIAGYIKSTLSEDQRFCELEAQDSSISLKTMENLIFKAEGVFLWAVLATRTLLGGLGNRYSTTQLLDFLDTDIPSDLESMFLQMLDGLPKADRRLAAISLLSMSSDLLDTRDRNPGLFFNVIFHWYIEETLGKSGHCTLNPTVLSRLNLQESTSDQIMAARSRFNSRCSSFIDWENPGGYTFHFIHRTLRDFLLLPGTRLRLQALAETADVHTITANACRNLLYDFSGPQKELSKSWPRFWNVFLNLVYIAEWSREDESEFFDNVAVSVIEDLPRAFPDIRTRTDLSLFAARQILADLDSGRHPLFDTFPNISYKNLTPVLWEITRSGHWNFLFRTGQKLIHQVPEISKPGTLLITAIYALFAEKTQLPKALHFVRLLLKEVDPSSTVAGHRVFSLISGIYFFMGTRIRPIELPERPFSPTASVWELVLHFAFYALRRGQTYHPQLNELLQLFLSFGANPDCWFVGVETDGQSYSHLLPDILHRVSLRQILSLSKLPISDTMEQHLQRTEIERATSSAITCLATDRDPLSSFFPFGVAEGQWFSGLGGHELYVYEFERKLLFGSSEVVKEQHTGEWQLATHMGEPPFRLETVPEYP